MRRKVDAVLRIQSSGRGDDVDDDKEKDSEVE
jgi:hypothetical protein